MPRPLSPSALLSTLAALATLLLPLASARAGDCGDSVVATVGGEPITLDDVDGRGDAELSLLKDRLYWARLRAADDLVSVRLIELEAKEEGLSVSSYMDREIHSKVPDTTPEEIETFWKENPGAAPPEQRENLRESVADYLKRQRSLPLRDALLARLHAKHAPDLVLDLPSPRIELDLAGAPVKGPASAPVTLVAYTDYQCGGCAALVEALHYIESSFEGKIRVVHRDFPADAHDRALPAAIAARCAGRFGKYWAYHDALFADPTDLSDEHLKAVAGELGLDPTGFGECLVSKEVAAEVAADKTRGEALGITGTPHLFLNGLSLRGGLDAQTIAGVVAMELDRLGVPLPKGG